MSIVYQHRRKDTNEVFYIGIGSRRVRAKSRENRNPYWHHVVNSVGYEIDILIDGCTREEAEEVEVGMIEAYGRRDLGTGPLVNMTRGGSGADGYDRPKHSKDSNIKRSVALKGKPRERITTDEVRKKISEKLKGRKLSEETLAKRIGKSSWNKGKGHSEEHKLKLKQAWERRKNRT